MSGAPDLVHGAWSRRSVSVSGSAHFETQQVIWLQAGTCYADIRVPFCPEAEEWCCAGRSGWDVEGYRWTRHLDLGVVTGTPWAAPDDVGELVWEGDALLERGQWPTRNEPVPFEEVWVRLPGDCGPFLALADETACLLQVGDHAITVVDGRRDGGTFAAAYRVLGPTGWAEVACIGPNAVALPRPDDPPLWPVIHEGVTEVLV
jgi:hypothetical protein